MAISRLWRPIPLLLVVCLLRPVRAAAPPTLDSLDKIASPLPSLLPKERDAGEKWLDANGDAALAELARLIEHGNRKQQENAAYTAEILISPWARGVRQGDAHKGQIELFQPRRPVARPVAHP